MAGTYAEVDLGPLIAGLAKGFKSPNPEAEDVAALLKLYKAHRGELASLSPEAQRVAYETMFAKKPGIFRSWFGDSPRLILPPPGGGKLRAGGAYEGPESGIYFPHDRLLAPETEQEIREMGKRMKLSEDEINDLISTKMIGKDLRSPEEKKYRELEQSQADVDTFMNASPEATLEEAIAKIPTGRRLRYKEHIEEQEGKKAQREAAISFRKQQEESLNQADILRRERLEETKRQFNAKLSLQENQLAEQKRRHDQLNQQARQMFAFKGWDAVERRKLQALKSQLDEEISATSRWNNAEFQKQKNDPNYIPNYRELPETMNLWNKIWTQYQMDAAAYTERNLGPGGTPPPRPNREGGQTQPKSRVDSITSRW